MKETRGTQVRTRKGLAHCGTPVSLVTLRKDKYGAASGLGQSRNLYCVETNLETPPYF